MSAYVIEHPRGAATGIRYGLIDGRGEVIVPPEADEIRYFFEGLASIRRGGKWGVIDEAGHAVVPCRYDALDVYSDGLCRAERRGQVLFIDREGAEHTVPKSKYVDLYSEGLCAVANDKVRWGFVDRKGALVIAHAFDEVGAFSEGLCAAKTRKGWGFIDTSGAWVIEPRFTRAWGMRNGRAQVVSSGKEARDVFADLLGARESPGELKGQWGLVDRSGHYVVAPRFKYRQSAIAFIATVQPRRRGDLDLHVLPPIVEGAAPLIEGHYRVRMGRGVSFVDADGRAVAGPFALAGQLVGGHALVQPEAGGPFRVFSAGSVSEASFASAMDNDDVHHFAEGLASVAVGELGAYRWGYVDARGAWVIEPRFRHAWTFRGALAKVALDDGIAYIDARGEQVWPA